MARVIKPEDTTRASAYDLWMKAPNPMVSFFKTLDVTRLVKLSRKKKLKFNMLIGKMINNHLSRLRSIFLLLFPLGTRSVF